MIEPFTIHPATNYDAHNRNLQHQERRVATLANMIDDLHQYQVRYIEEGKYIFCMWWKDGRTLVSDPHPTLELAYYYLAEYMERLK